MRHIARIINRQVNRWNSIAEALKCSPLADQNVHPDRAGNIHPVICFSRDLGSGSRIIAQGLCERLGYELFGSRIIDEISKDLQVQRQLVDSLDETAQNELDLMVETFLRGGEFDARDYYASLARVLKTLALKGGVVLLGRGAGFILRDQAALCAYITAPPQDRVQRLMAYYAIDEKTARDRIQESDQRREKFVRKVHRCELNDHRNYDLVINTHRMEPPNAVDLVLAALKARGYDLNTLRVQLGSQREVS